MYRYIHKQVWSIFVKGLLLYKEMRDSNKRWDGKGKTRPLGLTFFPLTKAGKSIMKAAAYQTRTPPILGRKSL